MNSFNESILSMTNIVEIRTCCFYDQYSEIKLIPIVVLEDLVWCKYKKPSQSTCSYKADHNGLV